MGTQAGEPQDGKVTQTREGGVQLIDGDAEPTHSGVHLHVNLHRTTAPGGRRREALQLSHVVHHGGEPL